MSISKTEFYDQPFIIREVDLEKFDDLLNNYPGDVKYSVETLDGFKQDYEGIEEILAIENSSSNPIINLTLSNRSYDPYLKVWLSFSKGKNNNIYMSLESDNDEVPSIFKSIDERLEGVKPWYSFISKADFINYAFIFFFLLNVLIWILIGFNIIQSGGEDLNAQEDALANLIGIAIVGGFFFLGWILNKIRNKVFPKGVFAIGQGIRRDNILEKVRWTVVIGGIVSLTVSSILLLF